MSKQNVLDTINKAIESEYGKALKPSDKFEDAGLDSLGCTLVLVSLDNTYKVLREKPADVDEFTFIGLPELTIRELINKCISSSTAASME